MSEWQKVAEDLGRKLAAAETRISNLEAALAQSERYLAAAERQVVSQAEGWRAEAALHAEMRRERDDALARIPIAEFLAVERARMRIGDIVEQLHLPALERIGLVRAALRPPESHRDAPGPTYERAKPFSPSEDDPGFDT